MDQHLDIDALEELKDVMEDEFNSLIETFVTDADKKVIALRAAVEAMDDDEISKVSHSFKGSCSNIGAPLLSDLCRQSEDKGRNQELDGIAELFQKITEEYDQVRSMLLEQMV